MEQRCKFLEECPYVVYNCGQYFDKTERLNTHQLRSILFTIMLREVYNFCQDGISSKDYQQVYITSSCICVYIV